MKLTKFDTGWIAGFIESEGIFTTNTLKFKRKSKSGIKNYFYLNPAFYLVSKDKAALEIVRSLLKMGKINKHGEIFHLDIRRKDDSIRLAAFLEGKLKSDTKSQQFEIWKRRVMEWKSRAWGEGVAQIDKKEQQSNSG